MRLTSKDQRNDGHDERGNPHEEDGGDGNVDGWSTPKFFDDVKTMSLDDVVCT